MLNLPHPLARSLEKPRDLEIVLVIGAGCSLEAPTDLALGSTYAQEAHTALVRYGVIEPLEDPWDLSSVADAVFEAKGSQKPLTDELPLQRMKMAKANSGYMIAAALQEEGIVRSVLSLNYDSAGVDALTSIGATVHVVDGVQDLPIQGQSSFVFLNGSARSHVDRLVLTKSDLENAWVGGWQQVVTTQALNSPTIVFVGLGSAAKLLSETLTLVTNAVGDATQFLLVGPGEQSGTQFAETIGATLERCVDASWVEFMEACAAVTCSAQARLLESRFPAIELQADVNSANCDAILEQLRALGLVAYGIVRGVWSGKNAKYAAHPIAGIELDSLANEIHFLGEIAQSTERVANLRPSGDVVFTAPSKRDFRIALFAPDTLMDFEAAVAQFTALHSESRLSKRDLVVVSRTNPPTHISAPESIVRSDDEEYDIVRGSHKPPIHYINTLRQGPHLIQEMIN